MATLERESNGGLEIVRYRGRLLKQPRDKDGKPSKELRRICVLSEAASYALEHWGITQPCYGECSHLHYTRAAVEELVRENVMRWIGQGKNIAAWTGGREWKPKPSGAERVMVLQLA